MEHFALFPTPVFVFDVPDADALNHDLVERLVAEAAKVATVERANVGGWHSMPDLALREEPCFQAVVGLVIEHVATAMRALAGEAAPASLRYAAQAWAMVMRDGDYVIPHEHGDAHWSAVYYADAGDADAAAHPASGLLAMVDPRRGGRPIPGLSLAGETFTVRPQTSRLVLFPGWLVHHVHPYRGRRPRVAVACNVSVGAQRPAV